MSQQRFYNYKMANIEQLVSDFRLDVCLVHQNCVQVNVNQDKYFIIMSAVIKNDMTGFSECPTNSEKNILLVSYRIGNSKSKLRMVQYRRDHTLVSQFSPCGNGLWDSTFQVSRHDCLLYGYVAIRRPPAWAIRSGTVHFHPPYPDCISISLPPHVPFPMAEVSC